MNELNPRAAREWVEYLIEENYSYDTCRLCIPTASTMITWLDEQGLWHRKNPFSGILKRYKGYFPLSAETTSYLSDEEMNILLDAARDEKYRAALIFIEVARCTGLRPSEILGIKDKELTGLNINKLDFEK